jgi:hypothetical protein
MGFYIFFLKKEGTSKSSAGAGAGEDGITLESFTGFLPKGLATLAFIFDVSE